MSSLYDDSDSNEERMAFQNGGGESWKVQHMYNVLYTRLITAGSDFTGDPPSRFQKLQTQSLSLIGYTSLLPFPTFS